MGRALRACRRGGEALLLLSGVLRDVRGRGREARRTRHFEHEPGAKCYIDWAGDTAHLTDRLSGATTKVYVLVVVLPFSSRLWAWQKLMFKQGAMHVINVPEEVMELFDETGFSGIFDIH